MAIRVGFIGLGNQGKPIAAHLAPAGFETTVYDIAKDPVEELVATGAKAAATPREVGAAADVVGICVPEDEHVRAVVFGDDGLLAGLSAGSVVLIHSTVLPATVEEVGRAAAAKNVEVLDACVTGGAARAQNRQLTYLVGGSEAAFEKARPYFAANLAQFASTPATTFFRELFTKFITISFAITSCPMSGITSMIFPLIGDLIIRCSKSQFDL